MSDHKQDRRQSLALISDLAASNRSEKGQVIQNCRKMIGKNYSDILTEAPSVIASMRYCYIAASKEKAATIRLVGNFEYKTLRANLMQCGDMGRQAFAHAQSQMHQIQLVACHICDESGPVSDSFPALILILSTRRERRKGSSHS